MKELFTGIRIVELTGHHTGPLTGQALSNLGAEVIKLETRSSARPRMIRPPAAGVGQTSPAFAGGSVLGDQKSTNKLSITLNYSSPKGLELAHRLIAKSDIFIENLAGGVVARRGLGYEDLKKVRPDLIMLSTCMQGQTGPHASHAGSGHKLSALSGFNYITGYPDRPPAWVSAYTDEVAPCYNVIALLAALDYRRRTGKGQFLDMSQNETAVQFMAPSLLDYAANGRVAERTGNKLPYAAPHNAYRCRGEDRWCAISVFTDEEWQSFCQVIGNPALATDPRFATLLARKENEEELDRLVNEWTESRYAEEVMALMQAAGVPAGAVETAVDQARYDPQVKYRHFLWELENAETGGKFYSPAGTHFNMSKTPLELRRAPVTGEHNEYVFKEIIGLSDSEYEELVERKVID